MEDVGDRSQNYWRNSGKILEREEQKVGVAADKFVSVGEDAEGIQIITDLLCSVK